MNPSLSSDSDPSLSSDSNPSIGLDVELRNESAEAWSAVPYAQMLRHYVPNQRKYMAVDTYSFRGPVVYNGESYEKLDFDDLKTEPLSGQYTNGWFASIQHHFLAAADAEACPLIHRQGARMVRS